MTAEEDSYGFRKCCEIVKGAVPLVEYAGALTTLRRRGTVYVGLCPLADHDEKTPSFTVWPEDESAEQSWWCFGCDRGSDLIDLHALVGGHAEMWSAMVSLSEMYGVELPGRSEGWKEAQGRRTVYRERGDLARGRTLARRVFAVEYLPELREQFPDGGDEYESALREQWSTFYSPRLFSHLYAQLRERVEALGEMHAGSGA